ncbi:MAG: GNAT family N-acetyltransferase [Solobacterium sp.]|nr:GNAT family N-acetyltransferase [Solobacterium sp.]
MELVKVTKENIEEAVSLQKELFPDENGRANLEASLRDGAVFTYALIYEDGVPAGIIGIYEYPKDHESAWLGWFGIREGFRRRHLGSEAVRRFEEEASARGTVLPGFIQTRLIMMRRSRSIGKTTTFPSRI